MNYACEQRKPTPESEPLAAHSVGKDSDVPLSL